MMNLFVSGMARKVSISTIFYLCIFVSRIFITELFVHMTGAKSTSENPVQLWSYLLHFTCDLHMIRCTGVVLLK